MKPKRKRYVLGVGNNPWIGNYETGLSNDGGGGESFPVLLARPKFMDSDLETPDQKYRLVLEEI